MIDDFHGPYRYLSNFYGCPVTYKGLTFKSAEAAYQAQKANSSERKMEYTYMSSPEARKQGQLEVLPPDWEEKKIRIMTEIVREKFNQNPILKKRLLETGEEEIVEGNTWHDEFWGISYGIGQNNLGKILMMLRHEFRELSEIK